jgi:hypothetical protein
MNTQNQTCLVIYTNTIAMEVRVCVENCGRGMFITLDNSTGVFMKEPRVNPALEKSILKEYKATKFEIYNDDLSIAKTDNFVFKKFKNEEEENIIWVEPIEQSLDNSVII